MGTLSYFSEYYNFLLNLSINEKNFTSLWDIRKTKIGVLPNYGQYSNA